MAGLTAAWRLSEPGWRDRLDSITVYQRGWRLGGKGASSRGPNGRIEEHGLHIWLGYYENAFGMLRECYSEIDRATNDPTAPITTWDQALIPGDNLGLADRFGNDWLMWLGTFTRNGGLPGEPDATGREMTVLEFTRRAVRLVRDFAESQRSASSIGLELSTSADPTPASGWIDAVQCAAMAALLALADPHAAKPTLNSMIDNAVTATREALDYERRPDHRRSWQLLSMMVAVIRGILADNLVTDPRGFRAINDEDYNAWLLRHGAHPDVLDFALVRGLYDLVFAYEDADPQRPAFGAGQAIFLTALALFQYKGAIFWKMTAGMGDIVVAPLYQALRQRGVDFEFFHRLDALHLDDQRLAVESITMGRQVHLAEGLDAYDPLFKVHGLPVFPSVAADRATGGRPNSQRRLAFAGDLLGRPQRRRDAGFASRRRFRPRGARGIRGHAANRGRRNDRGSGRMAGDDVPRSHRRHSGVSNLAPPRRTHVGLARACGDDQRLPPALRDLGIDAADAVEEDWPEDDRPGTVAYFCGTMDAPWPTSESEPAICIVTSSRCATGPPTTSTGICGRSSPMRSPKVDSTGTCSAESTANGAARRWTPNT